jgi:oligopeptide/dipeptide ABC transporter ATP-binding protein
MPKKQPRDIVGEVSDALENQHSATNLLDVIDLTTLFRLPKGKIFANKNVSLSIERGKTLGIVGESGSGKSVFCRSILRLIPSPPGRIAGGQVWFEEKDLLKLSESEMQKVRGTEIAMIFQDPMTSLNPVWRIGDQITEGLRIHDRVSGKQAREIGVTLLRQVGIPSPEQRIDEYPHRLSGGMRQRVMIAMAIASKPKLLLADEPTTALDVTIQDQILSLMLELQDQVGMSIILVSHDMGIVAETSDRVAVMYAGEVMEQAPTEAIFRNPLHPYTLGLLLSIPRMEAGTERLIPIEGQPPDLLKLPVGCPFADRCSVATPDCAETPTTLRQVEPNHYTACLYPERVNA